MISVPGGWSAHTDRQVLGGACPGIAVQGATLPRTMGYDAVLHLHTWRCKHAVGEAIDYVAAAVAGGCGVVGVSDHMPQPDGRWSDHRMDMGQLAGYQEAVRAARRAYPTTTVLMGLECEYVPEALDFQRALLAQRGFDYLILGQHFTPMDDAWTSSFEGLVDLPSLRAYATACIRGMETGLYAFVAHPDIFGCCGTTWGPDQEACADELCAAAAALQVPLEINGYGLRKPPVDTAAGPRPMYPWLPFWAVAARHRCPVVLSSDAHRPQDTLAGHAELAALRDRYGLVEEDVAARIVAGA